MEQTVKTILRHTHKNDKSDSTELSDKLNKIVPPVKKIEKAKEFLRNVDPEHFKELTGKDVFKK